MSRLLRPVPLFVAGLVVVLAGFAVSTASGGVGAALVLVGLGVVVGSPFARVRQARRSGEALPYAGGPAGTEGVWDAGDGGDFGGGDFGGDGGGG